MRAMLSVARLIAVFAVIGMFVAVSPSIPVGACVPALPPPPGSTRPPPTPTPTINEAAAKSDVVFRGHPIRREDVSYKVIDAYATRTTFAVETLWKGPAAQELTVFISNCGAPDRQFAMDGTYIVYATKGSNADLFPLSGLSRRASASDQEDLTLGPGITAPAPTATTVPIAVAATSTPANLATSVPLATVSAPIVTSTKTDVRSDRGIAPYVLTGFGGIGVGALIAVLVLRRRSG